MAAGAHRQQAFFTVTPHFLINIGNTRTQFACVPDGQRWTVPTADLQPAPSVRPPFSLSNLPKAWTVASVVPGLGPVIEKMAAEAYAVLHWASGEDLIGIDTSGVDLSTIGADRVANVAAAAAFLPLPAIIIDCGTAITTEVVGPGPRFYGGAILPGRMMQRQALRRFAAQLPEVPLDKSCPRAFGSDTFEAIRAGIDAGILGTIQSLVQRTVTALGFPESCAWATGGDAGFFCSHLKFLKPAPADFTLKGLEVIADRVRVGTAPMPHGRGNTTFHTR